MRSPDVSFVGRGRFEGEKIVRLSLEDTDVDDAVVPHLLALRGLRTLVIWGTRLSTKGLATLRAGLPGRTVVMNDPGQRLARERSRRAIMALLASRLRPDVRRKLSDAETRALIPRGSWLVGMSVLGSQRTALRKGLDIGDFDIAYRRARPFALGLRPAHRHPPRARLMDSVVASATAAGLGRHELC